MNLSEVFYSALAFALVVLLVCVVKRCVEMFLVSYKKHSLQKDRQASQDPLKYATVPQELRDAMEPTLQAWHDADDAALPVRMDKTFLARMRGALQLLRRSGLRREWVFSIPEKEFDGNGFRKWNEGGREWREGSLLASALETYRHLRSGEIVNERYYPKVRISVLQSRHIRYEDAKKAAAEKKDKFGYQKKKKPETPFYEERKTIICKSCGAQLEIQTQQVTCPYCGAQIFSDFHDWQTAHFAVEPLTGFTWFSVVKYTLLAFAASFLVFAAQMLFTGSAETALWAWALSVGLLLLLMKSDALIGKRIDQKRKASIVRFSEHQLKVCMYEELWKREGSVQTLDFFLGDVKIKKVQHSEDTTELTLQIPIFKETLNGDAILFAQTDWKGVAWRARYPERLRSKGVLLEERECPSCGGDFLPDEHGCCSFCGYGLRTSNAKWKIKNA